MSTFRKALRYRKPSYAIEQKANFLKAELKKTGMLSETSGPANSSIGLYSYVDTTPQSQYTPPTYSNVPDTSGIISYGSFSQATNGGDASDSDTWAAGWNSNSQLFNSNTLNGQTNLPIINSPWNTGDDTKPYGILGYPGVHNTTYSSVGPDNYHGSFESGSAEEIAWQNATALVPGLSNAAWIPWGVWEMYSLWNPRIDSYLPIPEHEGQYPKWGGPFKKVGDNYFCLVGWSLYAGQHAEYQSSPAVHGFEAYTTLIDRWSIDDASYFSGDPSQSMYSLTDLGPWGFQEVLNESEDYDIASVDSDYPGTNWDLHNWIIKTHGGGAGNWYKNNPGKPHHQNPFIPPHAAPWVPLASLPPGGMDYGSFASSSASLPIEDYFNSSVGYSLPGADEYYEWEPEVFPDVSDLYGSPTPIIPSTGVANPKKYIELKNEANDLLDKLGSGTLSNDEFEETFQDWKKILEKKKSLEGPGYQVDPEFLDKLFNTSGGGESQDLAQSIVPPSPTDKNFWQKAVDSIGTFLDNGFDLKQGIHPWAVDKYVASYGFEVAKSVALNQPIDIPGDKIPQWQKDAYLTDIYGSDLDKVPINITPQHYSDKNFYEIDGKVYTHTPETLEQYPPNTNQYGSKSTWPNGLSKNHLSDAGETFVQIVVPEDGSEPYVKFIDHAYYNTKSDDAGEVPNTGIIPQKELAGIVDKVGDFFHRGFQTGFDPNAPNTGAMSDYPPSINGDVKKSFEIPYSGLPQHFKDKIDQHKNKQSNQQKEVRPDQWDQIAAKGKGGSPYQEYEPPKDKGDFVPPPKDMKKNLNLPGTKKAGKINQDQIATKGKGGSPYQEYEPPKKDKFVPPPKDMKKPWENLPGTKKAEINKFQTKVDTKVYSDPDTSLGANDGDLIAWGGKPKGPPTTKFTGMKGRTAETDAMSSLSGMGMGLSPEAFKKKYGISPQEYLNLPQSQSSVGGDTQTAYGGYSIEDKKNVINYQKKLQQNPNYKPKQFEIDSLIRQMKAQGSKTQVAHYEPRGRILSENKDPLRGKEKWFNQADIKPEYPSEPPKDGKYISMNQIAGKPSKGMVSLEKKRKKKEPYIKVTQKDLAKNHKLKQAEIEVMLDVIKRLNLWVEANPGRIEFIRKRYPKDDPRLAMLNFKHDMKAKAAKEYMEKQFPENKQIFNRLKRMTQQNIAATSPSNFKAVENPPTYKDYDAHVVMPVSNTPAADTIKIKEGLIKHIKKPMQLKKWRSRFS